MLRGGARRGCWVLCFANRRGMFPARSCGMALKTGSQAAAQLSRHGPCPAYSAGQPAGWPNTPPRVGEAKMRMRREGRLAPPAFDAEPLDIPLELTAPHRTVRAPPRSGAGFQTGWEV